jgi:hypothetical protein
LKKFRDTLFEELRNQNPRVLKSGETTSYEYKQMWETLSAGGMWKGIFHNKKKNGELFWESATISPIKDVPWHNYRLSWCKG